MKTPTTTKRKSLYQMSLLEPAHNREKMFGIHKHLIRNINDRLIWLFHAESRPAKSPQPHTNRQFKMVSNLN